MPTPTDTIRLLRSLELITESVARLHKNAESVLQEINATGVGSITRQLTEAAVAAGMPENRAYDYAEEYAAVLAEMKRHLRVAEEQSLKAQDNSMTLAHIARVVPHRCPAPERSGGVSVLMLRD